MTVHLLERQQFLPRPPEIVFPFFADAANLEIITPPWLHFRILTPLPITMNEGTRIAYRIRWRWVPWRWLTEIIAWNPPRGFVDQQLQGPYRLWHHTHQFKAQAGGTLMIDTVRYALPLGPLGSLAHRLVVRRDLERIFDYRKLVVEQALKAT
jgi:ligand-binding SRPBCC domain-containing protein